MILVGGVFGFHLQPDMQVHLALFLIALMIVAHLVAMPFDELTKAHRVLHWLELGSLCVCWLTLHSGTVFFIGEKEGRISHESLTALSFYVVGGNALFTLVLAGLYVRAAFREKRTGGAAEQRRVSPAAQSRPRISLQDDAVRKRVMRRVHSVRSHRVQDIAMTHLRARRSKVAADQRIAQTRLKQRLKQRQVRNALIATRTLPPLAETQSARPETTRNRTIEDETAGRTLPPLPEGWFEATHGENTYYYHGESGAKQWTRPGEGMVRHGAMGHGTVGNETEALATLSAPPEATRNRKIEDETQSVRPEAKKKEKKDRHADVPPPPLKTRVRRRNKKTRVALADAGLAVVGSSDNRAPSKSLH